MTDDEPQGGAYYGWAPAPETEESKACKEAHRLAYEAARAAGASEERAQIAGAHASAAKLRELRGLPPAEPGPYDDWGRVPAWKGKRRPRKK